MPTPVSGSVLQFIDLARGIVGLMLLWYIVKFFLVAPPTEESKKARKIEQDEKAKKFRDFLGGKYKEHKEAGEKKKKTDKEKLAAMKATKKREGLLSPIRGYLVEVQTDLGDLKADGFSDKTDEVVKEAKEQVKGIVENLKNFKKGLRAARHSTEGEKKVYLQKMYDSVEAIMSHLDREVVRRMPDPGEPDATWRGKVTTIKNQIGTRIVEVGQILVALERFIEEDKSDSALPHSA
ncbi:hypothetical protein HOE37_01635 [Candidatus Woesearchaeota archaeon]|jgi:tRNA U54 and U55 pseudouridine synthase Pus10|nr:hypothetical protein [Candidatus Woesearchaeota archaeon]MBT4110536.1 hypothetical protein [Candidatus Woesearchaeota archaeon]MBT4335940.1 hypothetical protein [Candidatus Woesearchaeota archaeon]MBT4469081.1 hypothetical protein [Candidatus Woesearchaeota archaeon]MBT6744600.1 hypothetical protein [Candidatus Woesearchaeota archaeon]